MSKELDVIEYLNALCDYQITNKNKDNYEVVKQALEELDKFKALLNKYEIKNIEALEALIKDYDGMAKAFVQHVLSIEIEVKS